MKVLHIINDLSLGGAQTQLLGLLHCWNSEPEMMSRVVCLLPQGDLETEFRRVTDVHHLGLRKSVGMLGQLPFGVVRLRRVVHAWTPDVIQTWLHQSDLAGSVAGLALRSTPVVWGLHHGTFNPAVDKWTTRTLVRTLGLSSSRLAAGAIACGYEARSAHKSLGYRIPIVVVPNGVKMTSGGSVVEQDAAKRELGIEAGTPIVAVVARYHPMKGHDVALYAAALLKSWGHKFRWIMAGSGVDSTNASLVKLVNDLDLRDTIDLLGPRRDLDLIYGSSDLLCIPSVAAEGLPMVLLEAIAYGLGCVATDTGDCREILEPAWLTPVRNPTVLAHRIAAWLALNEEERNASIQRLQIILRAEYTIEASAKGYQSVYERLLANKTVT